MGDIG